MAIPKNLKVGDVIHTSIPGHTETVVQINHDGSRWRTREDGIWFEHGDYAPNEYLDETIVVKHILSYYE